MRAGRFDFLESAGHPLGRGVLVLEWSLESCFEGMIVC
jgi:hypothetical protein